MWPYCCQSGVALFSFFGGPSTRSAARVLLVHPTLRSAIPQGPGVTDTASQHSPAAAGARSTAHAQQLQQRPIPQGQPQQRQHQEQQQQPQQQHGGQATAGTVPVPPWDHAAGGATGDGSCGPPLKGLFPCSVCVADVEGSGLGHERAASSAAAAPPAGAAGSGGPAL
jgi:hypothetical protein